MSFQNTPSITLEDVSELKRLIATIRTSFQEVVNDQEYHGEVDLLLATADNLEESIHMIEKIGQPDKMSSRQKARFGADLNFFMAMLSEGGEEDEEFIEEEEFLFEEEDEEEHKPKKK